MDLLQLPCAHGVPPVRGRLRVEPEDFVVREWLGFAADGEGDHWLLTVRKRGANTHWVAKQLGRLAQIHPRDVGFAGLKDRHAVTEQAFTLPVRSAMQDWSGVTGEGFEVIRAERHRRKLKRGALRGNEFDLLVRDLVGDTAAVGDLLARIGAEGVPNYFGPQRFGIDGANLARARRWLGGEIELNDRFERGFALSAARSALFNDVLTARVAAGTWNRLQSGDVANLDGTNSVFKVDALDDTLTERCRIQDIHPTGPLWGRGELASQAEVAALEREVAQHDAVLSNGLATIDMDQERRSLRLRVSELSWALEAEGLRLKFRLPRGAFATAVLHELLQDAFAQALLESDEE
ncbi:MAG TPA: tRNA pseudouridine(13) synthase TruD [Povalibacter sp.]|uniref:tRNA pseudouridine(13) synthase TruD n=1 Tax=Povalibacter sp. TaxID=1962978 RepID=UPI002C5F6F51|nr:tRNA pseudouridine(13) synthase TruD [Povalibacter sp.]HMN44852.1 tRNA pseudouridine(13) synthase TruD [Povalibacter sp.]